jgi:hypothetical protein
VNLLGRDLGITDEVELLQGLHAQQTGFANAPFAQPLFAFLEFGRFFMCCRAFLAMFVESRAGRRRLAHAV